MCGSAIHQESDHMEEEEHGREKGDESREVPAHGAIGVGKTV